MAFSLLQQHVEVEPRIQGSYKHSMTSGAALILPHIYSSHEETKATIRAIKSVFMENSSLFPEAANFPPKHREARPGVLPRGPRASQSPKLNFIKAPEAATPSPHPHSRSPTPAHPLIFILTPPLLLPPHRSFLLPFSLIIHPSPSHPFVFFSPLLIRLPLFLTFF